MAENRKENEDGLYYLKRSQLAILVTGLTLSTAVIFFLGILIGQRIEEKKLLKKDDPVVKIPVQPSLPNAGAAPKEELTFYDTLAKTPQKAPPPTAAGKAAKEAQPEPKPAVKDSRPAAQAAKAPQAEKGKQQEAKAAVKEVKIVTKGETAQSGQNVKERVEKIAPQKAAEAGAAKGKQESPWAVQVNAFPHERDAKGLVKKLVDKGYDAYAVSANIKGKTWYRVRVGHLGTRDEAKALQETLKKKENYPNVITVSR